MASPARISMLILITLCTAGLASALADEFQTSLPPNCYVGSYRNPSESVAPWKPGCPGWSICEPGFWCDGVSKYACPAGFYGDSYGLTSEWCSGPCAAGYTCNQWLNTFTNLMIGSLSPTQKVRAQSIMQPKLRPCTLSHASAFTLHVHI